MAENLGRDIRIGSLATHGPFQDLLGLLAEWEAGLAAQVVSAEGDANILKAHSRAQGAANAVAFIKSRVNALYRAHFTEGETGKI